MNISFEEKVLTALFLCSDKPNEMLGALKPDWNERVLLPVSEKCPMLNAQCSIFNVFPWKDELSEGIDHEKYCQSFLIQPDLFIRLRPGKEKIVIQKLQRAGIDFTMIFETCIALPNASKLDEIIELDSEAVIQDYNSQQTGQFIRSALATLLNNKPVIWDCCAGSGGKSIMAYDIDPNSKLTVSDVRESILNNLKKRFHRAGINNFKSFLADLTHSPPDSYRDTTHHSPFDLIIADVPCTGSGTWSRTPEQLYFFDEKKIEKFATLQKKIVSNVIPQLQPGGIFIYITCSVFKKENEEVVAFIKEKFHLQLKQMEVLKGFDKKADSMFVAVLSLPKHQRSL